jgi:DHA2 family multidrug resistance protein
VTGPAVIVRHPAMITGSVMLATIMQALDTTIANVALPRMQGTLSATQDQMVWVLTSYIVASAIMIPLTGWLSGRYERKRVFLISIAGFTVASVLCGMAASLPQMVIFRLLQGISGAALVPLSQAVLFDINAPANYGKAMSFWGVGVMLGPILGPTLGGWLTEDYNWRWVFYINVPIGILAFAGLFLFLPESPAPNLRAVRLFRLRHAQFGYRLAADDAGSRRTAELVSLRARSSPRRCWPVLASMVW